MRATEAHGIDQVRTVLHGRDLGITRDVLVVADIRALVIGRVGAGPVEHGFEVFLSNQIRIGQPIRNLGRRSHHHRTDNSRRTGNSARTRGVRPGVPSQHLDVQLRKRRRRVIRGNGADRRPTIAVATVARPEPDRTGRTIGVAAVSPIVGLGDHRGRDVVRRRQTGKRVKAHGTPRRAEEGGQRRGSAEPIRLHFCRVVGAGQRGIGTDAQVVQRLQVHEGQDVVDPPARLC